jgi:outer membrane protein assembly factor BamA
MRSLVVSFLLLLSTTPLICQTCEHDASEHAKLESVEFVGAENVNPEVVATMIGRLRQDINEECQLRTEFEERVLDQFQRFGYFKALTEDHATLRALNGTPKLKPFAARIKVNPGDQYRLDHIGFAHATVFPESDLRGAVPMVDGEIFDVEQMRVGIKNLQHKYGSRGYINFTPVPNTEIDDERKRITVTFDLDEGDQYRFGELLLSGPEPRPGIGKRLIEQWNSLVRGSICDSTVWGGAVEATRSRTSGNGIAAVFASLIQLGEFDGQKARTDSHTLDYEFHFQAPEQSEKQIPRGLPSPRNDKN